MDVSSSGLMATDRLLTIWHFSTPQFWSIFRKLQMRLWLLQVNEIVGLRVVNTV